MLTINIEEMITSTKAHIAADSVRQGHYWKQSEERLVNQRRFTGCFIGCLTHGSEAQDVTDSYGIPHQLVRELESIFETLPSDEIQTFFLSVATAIGTDGKDLTKVMAAFIEETIERATAEHGMSISPKTPIRRYGEFSRYMADEVYEMGAYDESHAEATGRKLAEIHALEASILELLRDAPTEERS
jgi:hypothetical protein